MVSIRFTRAPHRSESRRSFSEGGPALVSSQNAPNIHRIPFQNPFPWVRFPKRTHLQKPPANAISSLSSTSSTIFLSPNRWVRFAESYGGRAPHRSESRHSTACDGGSPSLTVPRAAWPRIFASELNRRPACSPSPTDCPRPSMLAPIISSPPLAVQQILSIYDRECSTAIEPTTPRCFCSPSSAPTWHIPARRISASCASPLGGSGGGRHAVVIYGKGLGGGVFTPS